MSPQSIFSMMSDQAKEKFRNDWINGVKSMDIASGLGVSLATVDTIRISLQLAPRPHGRPRTADGPALYPNCGTHRGYLKHIRAKTKTCRGCKDAWSKRRRLSRSQNSDFNFTTK